MDRHSSADTTVGTAHGMKIAARTMPRPRNRLTGGYLPDADRSPDRATDAAKVDALLRRYLTGTAQRCPEIREEIRVYFRSIGKTSPI